MFTFKLKKKPSSSRKVYARPRKPVRRIATRPQKPRPLTPQEKLAEMRKNTMRINPRLKVAPSRRKEVYLKGTLFTFKDAKDVAHWVLLSSNAFRDRDGEVITTKALEHDVALWELAGRPQDPLRWWHVSLDDEHAKGLELGHVTFRMVHGHTLVEVGDFIHPVVAEAVYNAKDKLAGSIGFRHSAQEPDEDKTFHNIRTFERSLLPVEAASNPLTHLSFA